MSIENPWDIFSKNGDAIKSDFELVTKGRKSLALSSTNQVIAAENIFVEEGAVVECAILNASTGPIYIGKDAEIMEGSIVRGPFSLGEHSALKLGAKIYGPTTIGPHSKVGGEVNNSVIFGFSNKAHDGFLGNSVLGEWCNIGADSNNSNLKNNYAEVKLWNYNKERFVGTGLTFCGLIMGDHSKCGINTMFNTGTVVGVNANIFGSGFPRNFVASFSWGGAAGFTTYKLKDAFEVASKVFERRSMVFDETEQEILTHVFELTEKYRK
jgi:UDP-N-acetylglucosamine diphosphorylase/glucosamine-1-phosphate N-acetyltransferase